MRFGSGRALALVFLLGLTACGGGGEDGAAPPPAGAPIPPPVIGASGGTVSEVSGATVVVPAGAITTDTTIRIAMDSTGAPALPAALSAAGNVYVITPHGGQFAQPVEVSLPAPNVTLQPNQELKLAKAQPGGEWEVQLDTTRVDGKFKARVTSFSYFSMVIVTYVLPLATFEPLSFVPTITCGGQPCDSALGTVTATYTLVGNNGQLPCENGTVYLQDGYWYGRPGNSTVVPRSGITVTRAIPYGEAPYYTFDTYISCPGRSFAGGFPWQKQVVWKRSADYPFLSIMSMPTQLDALEGLQANLDALLGGGAVREAGLAGPLVTSPTATDRATVNWQRSDDGGKSWRDIARSYQDEANPLPFGTGLRWRPWGVRHGFIAAARDHGALIRVKACYTPTAPTPAPPCVTGPATLINVRHQGEIPPIVTEVAPTITQQPAATTVFEDETATFNVSASGSNLHYQWTRNGASIAGANQATYLTTPHTVDASGEVYRVIVFNATGLVVSQSAVLTVNARPPTFTDVALVSVALGGGPPGSASAQPSISADGTLVAFISEGIDLVPGTTVSGHAYVRNLSTGATTLIDQTPAGNESSRGVQSLKLASGGRYAVFTSDAGDLVPGDTNNRYDVFRRDLQTGTTIRLSVLPNGDELPLGPLGNGDYELDISGDGRGVLFRSFFDLTTDGHETAHPFLYHRNVDTGVTRLIAGNAQYASAYSALSDNGRWVVYSLGVPPPATQSVNLFDLQTEDLVTMYDIDQSSASAGLQRQGLSVSADGRYIAFAMVGAGGSPISQVYVVDRTNPGVATLVSTGENGAGDGNSAYPRLSGNGRHVLFTTNAPNLTAGQAASSTPYLVMRDLAVSMTLVGSRKFNGTDVPLSASGDPGYAIARDGTMLTFVADYAAVSGGMNGGRQVFAGPLP